MKTFSEKIKLARSELNISQNELAEKVGVSVRTIQAYEQEEKRPRQSTLFNLAKALGVSTKYLTDDECENPLEDIEKDGFIEEAWRNYGIRGVRDADRLLADTTALFAGGELTQEQKDAFFDAIMVAYVTCKQEAKKKFGHRNNG